MNDMQVSKDGAIEMPPKAVVALLDRSGPEERHRLLKAGVPYDLYLQTDAWGTLRAEALARTDGQCVVCLSRERVEVHHRHYNNIGRERLLDLIVLCREHHFHLHLGEAVEDTVSNFPSEKMQQALQVLNIPDPRANTFSPQSPLNATRWQRQLGPKALVEVMLQVLYSEGERSGAALRELPPPHNASLGPLDDDDEDEEEAPF